MKGLLSTSGGAENKRIDVSPCVECGIYGVLIRALLKSQMLLMVSLGIEG